MNRLAPATSIYVSQSRMKNAGRGVFAKCAIKKGEIIEKCPVIEIPEYEIPHASEGFLVTYFFFFGKKKEQMMLALGFGSLYNHTDQSNATYKYKQKEKVIDFVALADIKKDDEITVSYNSKNKSPIWFES